MATATAHPQLASHSGGRPVDQIASMFAGAGSLSAAQQCALPTRPYAPPPPPGAVVAVPLVAPTRSPIQMSAAAPGRAPPVHPVAAQMAPAAPQAAPQAAPRAAAAPAVPNDVASAMMAALRQMGSTANDSDLRNAVQQLNATGVPLTRQDLAVARDRSATVQRIRFNVPITESLAELERSNGKAVHVVPLAQIVGTNANAGTRGSLQSLHLMDLTSNLPVEVKIEADGVDVAEHLEYSTKHNARAIAWVHPGTDKDYHAMNGRPVYQRTHSMPVDTLLKFSGMPVEQMFSTDSVVFPAGCNFCLVNKNSHLGASIVRTANAEREQEAAGKLTGTKMFETHPESWGVLRDGQREIWHVDAEKVQRMKADYGRLQDAMAMGDLSQGWAVRVSRADGLNWANPKGVCSQLQDAAQSDVLVKGNNFSATFEACFLVPAAPGK